MQNSCIQINAVVTIWLQNSGQPYDLLYRTYMYSLSYYSCYTYSSHSFGYSFSFNLKVLGVRAIVSGFRVRVRVKVGVRIRIRGLGDQNYEVGFETIRTVTKNYANFDYSGYFSHCHPALKRKISAQKIKKIEFFTKTI